MHIEIYIYKYMHVYIYTHVYILPFQTVSATDLKSYTPNILPIRAGCPTGPRLAASIESW